MKAPGLIFNWFDFVVMGLLFVGLLRGRKRGMSEELLDLVQAVLMVAAAGLGYRTVSGFIRDFTGLPPLATNLFGYIGILIAIKGLFMLVKRATGEKLLGSDTFGRLEYPLGMISGVLRWACGLFMVLAVLNARLITDAEYETKMKADKELYGDNYFTIFSLGFYQRSAFNNSFVGPYIKQHTEMLLIEPMPLGDIMQKREGFGRQKEREMDDLMKGNKR